jgi:MFS superfamily sulfate permease-like transporter
MATLKTPSGHIVELKEKLTFGDKKKLKRILSDQIKIEISDSKKRILPFSSSVMADAEEEAVRLGILSITLANGAKAEGDLLSVVDSWDEADAQLVYDKVDELYGSLFHQEGLAEKELKKKEN